MEGKAKGTWAEITGHNENAEGNYSFSFMLMLVGVAILFAAFIIPETRTDREFLTIVGLVMAFVFGGILIYFLLTTKKHPIRVSVLEKSWKTALDIRGMNLESVGCKTRTGTSDQPLFVEIEAGPLVRKSVEYALTLTTHDFEGDTYTFKVSQDFWEGINRGDAATLHRNKYGQIIGISAN